MCTACPSPWLSLQLAGLSLVLGTPNQTQGSPQSLLRADMRGLMISFKLSKALANVAACAVTSLTARISNRVMVKRAVPQKLPPPPGPFQHTLTKASPAGPRALGSSQQYQLVKAARGINSGNGYTWGWKGQFKAWPCMSSSRPVLIPCHSETIVLSQYSTLSQCKGAWQQRTQDKT